MAAIRRGQTGSSIGSESHPDIIGASDAIEETRHSLSVFASTDSPVLIVGETGTGKELAAKATHAHSVRRNGPLIPVNCGALPANLVQFELCVHEKGASTGADRRHIGKLEAANTGTIFLEETGELPSSVQVNLLLRMLQEHRIQRVGGSDAMVLDLQVIAATNVDLDPADHRGAFREGLLNRMNVLPLRMPPLHERIEGIQPLATHVFQSYIHERVRPVKGLSPDALTAMRCHCRPGNVRDLINLSRRALSTSEGSLNSPEELGLEQVTAADVGALDDARSRAERETRERTFQVSSCNVSEEAPRIGIMRNTLYRPIQNRGRYPRTADSPVAGANTTIAGADGAL